MKKTRKRKQLTSLTAITTLLLLSMLISWGAGMYCLTSITAEYAASRYLSAYDDYASVVANSNIAYWSGSKDEDVYRRLLMQAAHHGGYANYRKDGHFLDEEEGFLNLPYCNKAYSSTAIYDAEGNLLECSWQDYFYFHYMTEEQWLNQEQSPAIFTRAFFSREQLTETQKEILTQSSMGYDIAAMRFIGSFDDVDFTPQKIEYIDHKQLSRYHQGFVKNDGLPWNTIYEDTSNILSDSEVVTLYSESFEVCYHQSSPSFSYKGEDYECAESLVAKLGPQLASGYQDLISFDGFDLLIPSVNYCISNNGELLYTPYYSRGAPLFYTVSVVYCSPWRTALEELRFVYLVTLLLLMTLVVIVRFIIKRHLIQPILEVEDAMTNIEEGISLYPDASKAWHESQLLQDGISKCRDKIRMQKNEIIRLNTALEYAKTAEENRRHMTSNIAHELKTPLAVIHSYAEGLKEYIAENKRDKYIDVILSEAKRTDNMVLEMLDLSRLEAGKVKLSRDDFSLISVTKAIFEKLEMTIQTKKLQVALYFPDDFTITADEVRITQVVENFVTNAVKYTPDGGHILVTIQNNSMGTSFSIENDSTPFSHEALLKIWNTFYRTDESRSSDGTGLGLAIAKNIVELHGGKCSVRNTQNGVQFEFTI